MDAALVLVRLLAFGAGVTLFGAPLFVLYSGPVDLIAPDRLRRLLAAAAAVSALAAVATLVLQTGEMAGDPRAGLDPATLRDVIAGGSFGTSILVRVGAALLALEILIARPGGRHFWGLTAAFGAIGLVALAWAGHGAADEGRAGLARPAAYVARLLAAGVWLGALLMLVLLLGARTPDPGDLKALHRALAGFSGVGSIVVAVIVASGLVNSWFLIGPGHLGDVAGSLWGRLLIVKLALFAAMLACAALNRLRLTSKLKAALAGDPRAALSALRRSLAVESAAAFAVLGLVAVLGALAPPASA